MDIGIIDYGMGNIGSIFNMIKKTGHSPKIVADNKNIFDYSKLILPGVGNFAAGSQRLKDQNFVKSIREFSKIKENKILGICLGMQLLFDSSEEGIGNGLGLIEGSVIRFKGLEEKFKIPHMGWNFLEVNKINSKILRYTDKEARFYFVHSYYVIPKNKDHILSFSSYGNIKFPCIVNKDNVFGTQFHPEKSHKYGFSLLRGFCEL